MAGFVERVAAAAPKVKPIKLILTLLAIPFYILGVIAGLLVVLYRVASGAFLLAIGDVQTRSTLKQASKPEAG